MSVTVKGLVCEVVEWMNWCTLRWSGHMMKVMNKKKTQCWTRKLNYIETNYKCDKVTHKERVKLNRKLPWLCSDSMWRLCDISVSAINLSSYVLNKVEEEVLSLGLSFAMKPYNSVALDFVSPTVNSRYEFPVSLESSSIVQWIILVTCVPSPEDSIMP